MRIFLATYTIRVDDRRHRTGGNTNPSYQNLSAYDGHKDLYDSVMSFLEKLESTTTNKTYMLYMKPVTVEQNGRIINGVLEAGNYGRSGNILDVKTDSVKYQKKWEDADVSPFYFLFYIPKNTNEGILLLQRTGGFGIKTNLGRFLSSFFRRENGGFP